MFDMFISAFSSACSMEALVANFIGVALGIVFGALPGLTAVMGVALLIPLTFGFPAVIAFSALLGMYCGAIYAGSITAILVGTPGTAAAAATMLEGPKFTARGESLKALEMTTIASFIGGIFSCIVLATVAPQLAHFALDFSAPEYFSLGIFGLTIVATLSEGALLKGCIAALLGMLISMIGMDPLSGNLRMTFDSPDLINGVSLVPALVGLYALSQVLVTIEDVFMGRKLSTAEISRKGISLPDLWANRAALIRGSLFGTFIGIVPATGSGTASFAAYSETKRHSKHPELFGKGTLEGIAATESANNAVTGATLIPLLTLGIPGDGCVAIMLSALMINGLNPGLSLFTEQGDIMYAIMLGLILVNAFMFVQGKFLTNLFAKVVSVPQEILTPIIVMFCFAGAFSVNKSYFDVLVALVFCAVAWLLRKIDFPAVPILLGLVLGKMAETNFRRALMVSRGSYSIFVSSPFCIAFLALTALVIGSVAFNKMKARKKKNG